MQVIRNIKIDAHTSGDFMQILCVGCYCDSWSSRPQTNSAMPSRPQTNSAMPSHPQTISSTDHLIHRPSHPQTNSSIDQLIHRPRPTRTGFRNLKIIFLSCLAMFVLILNNVMLFNRNKETPCLHCLN